MKKSIKVAVAVALALSVGVLVAQAQTPVDGFTNIFGVVTLTSTNIQECLPVPSGIEPLQKRFLVSSGTATFLGNSVASTTNNTPIGRATNLFVYGGTITFAAAQGWVTDSTWPVRGYDQVYGYSAGTGITPYTETGAVTTATIWYWIKGAVRKGTASVTGGPGH